MLPTIKIGAQFIGAQGLEKINNFAKPNSFEFLLFLFLLLYIILLLVKMWKNIGNQMLIKF